MVPYLPLHACCHLCTQVAAKSSSWGGPFASMHVRCSIVALLNRFRSLVFCRFWVLNALSQSAFVTGITKAIVSGYSFVKLSLTFFTL